MSGKPRGWRWKRPGPLIERTARADALSPQQPSAGTRYGPAMQGDRLTGLDASFLHLEDDAAHMHVASVILFEGDPPAYDDLLAHIERRLHLVPRYRQRLAFAGGLVVGIGRPTAASSAIVQGLASRPPRGHRLAPPARAHRPAGHYEDSTWQHVGKRQTAPRSRLAIPRPSQRRGGG